MRMEMRVRGERGRVQRESENTKKTQGNREIVIAHGLHKKNFDIKEKLLKKSFLKLFCVL